jgi:hypothetical protein
VSKQDAAPEFNRLRGELDAITSVGDLQQWADDNGALIATFRADWQKALRFRYTEKLAELRPAPQAGKTIVSAPKHALRQGGIAERAIEARQFGHQSRGPSQPFVATKDGPRALPPIDEAARALNRRLHPMNDELPGDLGPPKEPAPAKAMADDGIPGFLDRRRPNGGGEPSYLDLVEGGR